MGKTYAIAGGAGFIGQALGRALVMSGDRVRILHRRGGRVAGAGPVHGELVSTDLSDFSDVRAALDGTSGCFHLAADADVVLAAAADARVPVVVASSAAVYGQQPDQPVREDAPLTPLTPYGREKLAAEQAARTIHRTRGLPTLCLRFFNVYGPGQIAGRPLSGVVAKYLEALMTGGALDVEGDGRQKRDFLFIDDAVIFLRAGMDWLARNNGHAVLNACTGQPVTVLDLAAAMMRATSRRSELVFRPARSDDVLWSYGSPDSARSLLGVGAAVTLDAGVRLTVAGAAGPPDLAEVARPAPGRPWPSNGSPL